MDDIKIQAALFEASNWQNHATAKEKAELTYNEARNKVLQRIYEALKRQSELETKFFKP